MFVGLPPGNYDRLLDVSTAVTGVLFFVPSTPLLESLADDGDDARRRDDGDGDSRARAAAGTARRGRRGRADPARSASAAWVGRPPD